MNTSTEESSTNSIRNINNYNIWRIVIKQDPIFPRVLEETIERQKRGDDVVPRGEGKHKNLWQPHKKSQEYKQTTKDEFQSLLLKIIYCLIEEEDLENYGWYTVERELGSLLKAEPLMDVEDFIERLLIMGNVSKKRLQATINFYTRSMKIPDYYIPSNVELPKDREKKDRLAINKTIVLKDDFIDPISDFIDKEIQYKNYYNNQSLLRAAIAFNIIKGTGLRITNAYQIKLVDLEKILQKGEHKVMNLITKHGKVNFCYVTCKNKKALCAAIELYKKVPEDFLNKISSKSPTRFKDFRMLVDTVFVDRDTNFKSNMIRNYVADTILNSGLSLNKTSKLMNHRSVTATKHYINKFHPGPTLVNDESSNDGAEGNDERGLIDFN
ncbi:vlf-1 [Agrotis segetum granulovirus]|uniref:Vlf-1 n=1 Tax=Agrotis segetum granulosis virus TaxID=10464 RepID=A0A023MIE3_GVAS|nr:vlf-1 [Agrotis segetum granulovirus]AHN92147.1 vlf-1 [Agrotis segetum granulovirus]AKN63385.1 vlf-1 [Agrotis segetum granulovirus]